MSKPDWIAEREAGYRLSATLAELVLAGLTDPFDARDRAALAALGYRRDIEDDPPQHNHRSPFDAPTEEGVCDRCDWDIRRAGG